MFLVLAVTVLNRKTGTSAKIELYPFWSYQQAAHRDQILLNILMFIPVGLLGASWKTVGTAAFFSVMIEVSQLISYRGIFEFDDIIHNTLGTVIGVGLIILLRNLWKRFKK